MNIINLVNSISITSIPSRWTDFLNRNSKDSNTSLIELKEMKKIFSFKKEETIIHGHHVKSMTIFLIFNFFYNYKNIYTVHGSYLYLSKINKTLFSFVINNADFIVFVNTTLYDQLPLKIKNKIVKKYQIIFNGVENECKFENIDVLKKYNLDKKKNLYFSSG